MASSQQQNHNTYSLQDRVAIITGSDSGIGQGTARVLAQSGCHIVVCYNSDEKGAKETAKEVETIGRQALIVQVDVGDEKAVQNLFDKTLKQFNRLDILVNNAGKGGVGKPVTETNFDEWEKVIRTNLHGPFMCSKLAGQQFLKQLKDKPQTKENKGQNAGVIINISSVMEELVREGSAAYSASKVALRNLTRAMAVEMAPYGVRVCGVAPGLIESPMTERTTKDEEKRAKIEEKIPIHHVGAPEDIGHMVAFLCSDDARYCTGQTYFVDGGWLLVNPVMD